MSLSIFTSALVGALIFGAAGACGVLAGGAIVPRLERLEDGPPPVNVRPGYLIAGAALLGAYLGYVRVPFADFAVAALTAIALTAIWYCDALTGLVPDIFTLIPLGLAIAYGLVRHDYAVPISALALFAPFAVSAAISKGRGMGWGDAKLAALGGAVLALYIHVPLGGVYASILVFSVASLSAAVAGLIRRRGTKAPIAFAPYMTAGIAVAFAIWAP